MGAASSEAAVKKNRVVYVKPVPVAKAVVPTANSLNSTVNVGATQSSPSASVTVSSESQRLVTVNVTGNVTVATQLIIDTSELYTGDDLTPLRIGRVIRGLQSLGVFRDVRTAVTKTDAGKVLTVIVAENPRIGSIRFEGVTAVSDTALLASINSQVGQPVSLAQVRKDLRAIDGYYSIKGYDESKAVSFVSPESDGGALVFVIAEGILERVEVTGNTRTKEYVILREMVSKPGQPLSKLRLKQDYQRINNLGYFRSVVPQIRPGVSPNASVLTWEIEERENSSTFTAGGGYSPTGGFSFFSDVYWDNLFGTGQLVSAKSQFGRLTTYELKYSNPWVWDERKSVTIRTWLKDGQVDQFLPNSNSIGYRNERSSGVSFELGWPFSYEFGSFHTVKYESVQLRDVNKAYNLYAYTLGLTYDTRDIRFNPLEGVLYTLRLEKSFVINPDSLDLTRIDLDLRHFFKVGEQQTIATRILTGYLTSPKIGDKDLFLREFYRVGGSNTVRGWNDYYPFSVGSRQIVNSIEYRYIFNDSFSAVAFVDGGFATDGSIFNLNKYRIGKGVGVRFNVPILGPIRLDWAFGDTGDSYVHFSIGHTF